RVAQVVAGGAELHVSAGVGAQGRAARADENGSVAGREGVRGGAVVGVAAVVGDPAVGTRQGDMDRGRDVDSVAGDGRVRDRAAGHLVGGRAVGGAVGVVGGRGAGVAGRARERRRVAQVVAGGAELHVSAGVGAQGRAARAD